METVKKQTTKFCPQCGKEFGFGLVPSVLAKKKFCSVPCDKAAIRSRGPARFWAKVDKGPHPKGCWLYTGFIKWDGYGWLARADGSGKVRHMTAHRYAWILTYGEPAKGLSIMHLCDRPACCNPSHLRLGTHQENMADSKAKRRHAHGERSHHAKMTYPQVEEARRLRAEQGLTFRELGLRFGVGTGTVMAAVRGRSWRIPGPAPEAKMYRTSRPRKQM